MKFALRTRVLPIRWLLTWFVVAAWVLSHSVHGVTGLRLWRRDQGTSFSHRLELWSVDGMAWLLWVRTRSPLERLPSQPSPPRVLNRSSRPS